jgi:hypothetical protein
MEKTKHEIKRTINRLVRHKGHFPTLQEICNALNFSSDQAKKYLAALAEDNYVEAIGDWYRFPEDKNIDPKEFIIEEVHNVPVETVNLILKDVVEETQTLPKKSIGLKSFREKLEEEDKEEAIIGPNEHQHDPLTLEQEKFKEEHIEIEPSKSSEPSITLDKYKDEPIKVPVVAKKKFKFNTTKIVKTFDGVKEKIIRQEKRPKTDKNDMSLAVYVIKWSMLIVGIGSIIVSIFYNIKLSMEFLPGILAIIAGCIFVLFSVISFEVILLFISFRKIAYWKKTISIIGFIILWLIVATFSISATVSGRYERYMLNQQDISGEYRTISAGKLKWKNIQERKQDLIHRINEKRNQISQFNKISSKIEDISTREGHGTTFTDTQWRISQAEKDLDRYSQSLERLREEETKQLETSPETTAADEKSGSYISFYEWLSTIFGVPKEKIHFFLSLMPAFFFDVVSPIAIAIFLFLKKE